MWSEKIRENKNNFAGQSFSCTSNSCDQLYQAIFDTGVSEPPSPLPSPLLPRLLFHTVYDSTWIREALKV